MERPQKLQTAKKADSLPRKQSKRFYQTIEWKRTRQKLRKERRREHEKIVMDVYKANPSNDPKDLKEFLSSDMPLCEINLRKGIIKVASVLDHKMRIRDGGSKASPSNLQWVTQHEHAKKSGEEAHE